MKLEAVRGLAASYVVLHHTVNFKYYLLGVDLGQLLRFGQEAVILFFVVSGFVIHYSYQHTRDRSFSNYFMKRFLRIYVPLIVVFATGYCIESLKTGALLELDPMQLVGNLLMLQDWPADKPGVLVDPLLGNDPLWSLSYEWWFYMLYFPLMQLSIGRTRLTIGVLSVSVAAAVIYVIWPTFVPRLLMYLAIWWSGVHFAQLYIDKKPITVKSCGAILIALALICAVLSVKVVLWRYNGGGLYLGRHPLIELRHISFALFAIVAAIFWHRFRWRGFDWVIGPFAIIAPISYVIYIAHYHLLVTATWFDGIGNQYVVWVMYLIGLILFAWFVELRLYPAVRRKASEALRL